MTDSPYKEELLAAMQRYFDLMYDCDVSKFDDVFRETARMHGFRDGVMTMWTMEEYKEILAHRESPQSQGAPRDEEVLMVDFAADDLALVKARVRINDMLFTDYLTVHRIDGNWLITAKAYHLERI